MLAVRRFQDKVTPWLEHGRKRGQEAAQPVGLLNYVAGDENVGLAAVGPLGQTIV
ncbi:MAG: hypothetical protein JRC92_02805 [Deltaproteobacteria bacterium]|nr:hypothetical protein [Deltaproteobacteria bacterium]